MKQIQILACAGLMLLAPMAAPAQWKPAGDRIQSPWAASVSPASVLPEYPRPQMVREKWQSLNGLWNYSIVPEGAEKPAVPDGKILVPFAVESSLSGVARSLKAGDALWYETAFSVPRKWKGERILLHFDAVDWQAEVYVNDRFVGRHTGGYTAFSYDVTDYLTGRKAQKLVVKVLDATDNDFQPRGKQVMRPHGIWYTPVSGIWQSVWLEPVPRTHVTDYYAVSDIDRETVDITVSVADARPGDELSISFYEDDHKYFNVEALPGDTVTVHIPGMKLWSPDDPHLYDIRIWLTRRGEILDEVMGYTAMRKISVIEDAQGRKRMALNNQPLFQFGPLDQGFWPDGIYTAPTDEALKSDIVRLKEMGFNMIRKHIKVEPARWFWWCDKLGMLVWQDMPSFSDNRHNKWGTHYYNEGTDMPVTDAAKANYYKEWEEIIQQVKKFPCIVVWVPFNEAWSQFDTKAVADFTKRLDPTRLVNQSSGGNWVPDAGDIIDCHHYPNPWIPFWDFNMVNVLGEYGGIGYPVEGHLWQQDQNWGYVKYQDADAVLEEYGRFAEQLIRLVGFGCSAAVYTQTSDVEGEVNGLMTYDRRVIKLDPARLKAINTKVISSLDGMY